MENLISFLKNSYTAYQAVEQAKLYLIKHGFTPLSERDGWALHDGGKYFVERGGSALIAFTVDLSTPFSFKIVASHADSPALKLKEHPLRSGNYITLNTEPYGGGIWYSFFDRPLKIAGRVVVRENDTLLSKPFVSEHTVCIPSVAIHQNRDVNNNFSITPQTDLAPLFSLKDSAPDFETFLSNEQVVSYDLFLVNAESPYSFGANDEFLASPRIDNLTSVFSSVEALAEKDHTGICVASVFDNEEIGSGTLEGAGSDFMENVLKRIADAFHKTSEELSRAFCSSLLVSLDNAHAVHPNHPERYDPTNQTLLGGGVVIKSHAGKAYTTDAMSSAVIKTVFEKSGVRYQTFYNNSNYRSGGTLGAVSLSHVGIPSVDLGLAQLAMHSASECFCKADYCELQHGLSAFYSSSFSFDNDSVSVR